VEPNSHLITSVIKPKSILVLQLPKEKMDEIRQKIEELRKAIQEQNEIVNQTERELLKLQKDLEDLNNARQTQSDSGKNKPLQS